MDRYSSLELTTPQGQAGVLKNNPLPASWAEQGL